MDVPPSCAEPLMAAILSHAAALIVALPPLHAAEPPTAASPSHAAKPLMAVPPWSLLQMLLRFCRRVV